MYSSEDFERLFIRYKGEVYLRNESIQSFYHRNNVPYNLFEKWYRIQGSRQWKFSVVLHRRKWRR